MIRVTSSQVKGWLQQIVAKVSLKFQPKAVDVPGRLAHTEDRRVRKHLATKGNDMDPTMAQRLVDRRKAAGLSQEALADKLGVSRQAVSKWERSESSPDTDNLIALAALYGVSLDELLYGSPAQAGTASTEQEEPAPTPESVHNDDACEQTDKSEPSDDERPDLHASERGERVHISLKEGIHVVDPEKGEEVHVGWSGIHVENERRGEHVHIGPGGMHIDASDDGHSIHTNEDGTVTIDGETYASWKDAHDHCDFQGNRHRSPFGRAWSKFPFPGVVLVAYLIGGIVYSAWLPGLMLVFSIPVYYMVGSLIDQRKPLTFLSSIYPIACTAWFCYIAFFCNQAHPAWAIFLTIPVVEAILHWIRKSSQGHKAH